jgi:hypothetical protein
MSSQEMLDAIIAANLGLPSTWQAKDE